MNQTHKWRQQFFAALQHDPQRVVLVQEGVQWTYERIWHSAQAYGAYLNSKGVRPGDRVAVALEHDASFLPLLLGHYLTGVIHVPINTRYGRVELDHLFKDCAPKAIWLDGTLNCAFDVNGLAEDLNIEVWQDAQHWLSAEAPSQWQEEQVHDEDVAMLIYTSGTTGKSKGCALSYRAILSNIWHLSSAWSFSKEDKLVLALPLFHVHGLCLAAHSALWHGATLLMEKKFTPEAMSDRFANEGATVFMGVPTMYHRLLSHLKEHPQVSAILSGARLFTSGSAALSPAHFNSFYEATGHRILERYGMSETLLTLSNPYDGERRAGTVGLPVSGGRVEIRDAEGRPVAPGESGTLWVQGDSLMNGYWNNPEATAKEFQEGYFKTGDCVARDEAGYYRIVGRDSVDVLKVGGFKIGAREIEEVLESHRDIDEAAVIGLPDEEWGQRIEAFVVLSQEGKMNANTLKSFLQERIAGYKIPRTFYRLSLLPRNALGKIQKHRLKESRIKSNEI